MAEEFKPVTINSQEEMDNLFKERVSRTEKKYSGFISPADVEAMKADYEKRLSDASAALEEAKGGNAKAFEELKAKNTEYEKAIAEKDAAIKGYELSKAKTAIALESGLPIELAERLNGATEEELRKDAEALATMFSNNHSNPVPPLRNPETPPGIDAAHARVEAKYEHNPWYKSTGKGK